VTTAGERDPAQAPAVSGAGSPPTPPRGDSGTGVVTRTVFYAGPVLAIAVGLALAAAGFTPAMAWTAGVTVFCALWWVFEPIPIPAASLVPLAVLPSVGVLPASDVAEAFGSPIILLLMGGFMLSTAMARSGAHRRLALGLIHLVGADSPRRVVFGFMLAAALLSMWVANMATTLMLVPIGLAALERVDDARMKASLMLAIAYAASIGGIGTPIGTPPNLIFMQVYAEHTGRPIPFFTWMSWTLPIVVVMLPIATLWLTRSVPAGLQFHVEPPGRWRPEERRTLAVFAVTALAWMFRMQPFGGWTGWLGVPGVNDASIALAAVVAMFLIPNGRGERLLDWETAGNIPWGILILFSSGLVIAKAFLVSGLSGLAGDALAGVMAVPAWLVVLTMCLAVTFLTEMTSNTATTTLLMPILAAAALAGGLPLELVMVPAAISASFAFMLPVATGPNAIVYGAGEVPIREMARNGLLLNLVGAVVVSTLLTLRLG